ncbi:UNVERIFIED_CONTAM: hypothetical protein K2H54_002716 [Gekko kuhli]
MPPDPAVPSPGLRATAPVAERTDRGEGEAAATGHPPRELFGKWPPDAEVRPQERIQTRFGHDGISREKAHCWSAPTDTLGFFGKPCPLHWFSVHQKNRHRLSSMPCLEPTSRAVPPAEAHRGLASQRCGPSTVIAIARAKTPLPTQAPHEKTKAASRGHGPGSH